MCINALTTQLLAILPLAYLSIGLAAQVYAQHLTLLASWNLTQSSFLSRPQVAHSHILLHTPGMHSPPQSGNPTLFEHLRSVSNILYILSNALRS